MESSRRIVMFNWMTANGYFAGADGNLDWVVPDEEQAKAAVAGIPLFDTVLFGRRTYELFEKFWNRPMENSSTAPDPHHSGQQTRQHREIGIWLNEITKLVFSRTLKDVKWKNSRIVNELDPGEIETMKSGPGKDMIIFGSGSIVSQLTQHGLIDEYQVVLCPVLLGNGRPLLTSVTKTRDWSSSRPSRTDRATSCFATHLRIIIDYALTSAPGRKDNSANGSDRLKL